MNSRNEAETRMFEFLLYSGDFCRTKDKEHSCFCFIRAVIQDLRTPPFIPPQAGGRDVTLFYELPPVYGGTEGGIAKVLLFTSC
jgi:hypothetical protein